MDPSLVDDTDRLIDFLSASERLPRLLSRKDDRGYTLLHYAAERDRPESLKILLINGGKYYSNGTVVIIISHTHPLLSALYYSK